MKRGQPKQATSTSPEPTHSQFGNVTRTRASLSGGIWADSIRRRRHTQLVASLPTDYRLLNAIYERHIGEYHSALAREQRQSDIFVPVAMHDIAAELGISVHSVFGRLYYHLDPKHAPPPEPGKPRRSLFAPKLGLEANCINFPLLEAVVAGLRTEWRRQTWTILLSIASLTVAVASLIVATHHG
jgi:hypothetical protein